MTIEVSVYTSLYTSPHASRVISVSCVWLLCFYSKLSYPMPNRHKTTEPPVNFQPVWISSQTHVHFLRKFLRDVVSSQTPVYLMRKFHTGWKTSCECLAKTHTAWNFIRKHCVHACWFSSCMPNHCVNACWFSSGMPIHSKSLCTCMLIFIRHAFPQRSQYACMPNFNRYALTQRSQYTCMPNFIRYAFTQSCQN